MERKRLSNIVVGWRGDTVNWSVRLPRPISDRLDASIGKEGLPNRAAILQDAAAVWAILEDEDGNGRPS